MERQLSRRPGSQAPRRPPRPGRPTRSVSGSLRPPWRSILTPEGLPSQPVHDDPQPAFSRGTGFFSRRVDGVRGRFGLGRQHPPLANNRGREEGSGARPAPQPQRAPSGFPQTHGSGPTPSTLIPHARTAETKNQAGVAATTAGSLCASGGWPSAGYSGDALARSRPSDLYRRHGRGPKAYPARLAHRSERT